MNQNKLLIIDHTHDPYAGELLFPFAVEELLCRQVGEGKLPTIAYFWRHQKGLVLGLRDRRLPFAEEAAAAFAKEQYQVIVRHSGGAAVPLDAGVVNFSLILPKRKGRIDFHDDFEAMYALIKDAVETIAEDPEVTVNKGEIANSYCPGDFDLSIHGKKFCGLAQRRQTLGLSVQAFILASGHGQERANKAKRYYDQAAAGQVALNHPIVSPNSMGSLNELMGLKSELALVEALKRTLGKQYTLFETTGIPLESLEIDAMIAQLKNRYAKK